MDKLASPQEREILLHSGLKVALLEQTLFPAYLDGLRVWESDVALARFFARTAPHFAGRKLLELGCGTGLASLALASQSPSPASLLLTDYQPAVLALATKNIAKISSKRVSSLLPTTSERDFLLPSFPASEYSSPAQLKVAKLDWRDPEDRKCLLEEGPPDLAFGSDLVYQGSPYESLVELLSAFSKSNP